MKGKCSKKGEMNYSKKVSSTLEKLPNIAIAGNLGNITAEFASLVYYTLEEKMSKSNRVNFDFRLFVHFCE